MWRFEVGSGKLESGKVGVSGGERESADAYLRGVRPKVVWV